MVYNQGITTNRILGETMKLSIVTAVLNSHEVVRRQILHYSKMNLPNDSVEIIYVDDGSDVPIKTVPGSERITILETHDKRPWTQPTARNMGVKAASGEYLMLIDLDHIINQEVIDLLMSTDVDLVRFKRYVGVIDENGDFTQDAEVLKAYGLRSRYFRDGYRLPAHGNTFAIRRGVYIGLGGVSERYCGTGTYPNREEVPFKRIINPMIESGKVSYIGDDNRPSVYLIPNGKYCGDGNDKDYNPFGLFHTLNRDGRKTKFKRTGRNDKRTFDNNPG